MSTTKQRSFFAPNYCGVCGKTAHRSRGAARMELRAILKRDGALRRFRWRIYQCEMGCWHVGKQRGR